MSSFVPNSPSVRLTVQDEETFSQVVRLIASSRENALRAVNTAQIDPYWSIGETISRKIEASEWGDGVAEQLARFIAKTHPGLRGFTRPNLFRMKQFYELPALWFGAVKPPGR